jgi:hypothetical protein
LSPRSSLQHELDERTLTQDTLARATSSTPPRMAGRRDSEDPAWLIRGGPDGGRYQLLELIGTGGTSRVFAAFDRELEREVAIKILRVPDERERARCLREGRVMASLGHPNILPIYDVGCTDDSIYFTMPRFTGRNLGSVIRSRVASGCSDAMPVTTLVELALKLCDALAYAHARGVVHRDVKPANILIGDFGEVMLVDWGTATSPDSDPSTASGWIGTPAYMSPEQVHGEPATPRSDVYALGATLFHACLLRRALTTEEPDEFWRRKWSGELDAPTADELQRVPRPLLAIALKAMSHEPSARYANVLELAAALRDFLAGRGAWAAPSVTETFANDDYLNRWACVVPGDFVREPGRLISRCERGGLLIYKQRLAAGVAIEFDGEILEGAPPGDLSVLWSDEDLLDGGPHWPKSDTSVTLQVGAFANLLAGIYRDRNTCLSGRSLSIEVGRKYRIRAEIQEHALRLLLDGELIVEHEILFPMSSGHVALYSYYPGKAFSNVRVYERGLPERVSPIAIGDAFFARGEREHAAVQYLRVEQLLPSTTLAEEARYKRGLCHMMEGDEAAAENAWRSIGAPTWRARAALHAADSAFAAGRHQHVLGEIRRLARDVPTLRNTIIGRWTEYVNQLCKSDADALSGYLELRDELFPAHMESAAAAASAEIARGNFQRVLDHFPEQHLQVIEANQLLGQFERVVERYACAPWLRDLALLHLGRFDAPELSPLSRALARVFRGDPEGCLAEIECVEAELAVGRFERALATSWASPEERGTALRGLGRHAEAIGLGDVRSLALADVGEEVLARPRRLCDRVYLIEHLALRALVRGDRDGYRRLSDELDGLPCGAIWPDVWVARYLLFPLADEVSGKRGAFAESLRSSCHEREHHFDGKLAWMARYVLGEVSEAEFMAQPWQRYVQARRLFADALRAEAAGDREGARSAYGAYLALPVLQRHLDSTFGNPLVDRWIDFRMAVPTALG